MFLTGGNMSLKVEQGFFDFTGDMDSSGKFMAAEWPYMVFGEATEAQALAAVLAAAPATFEGLRRDKVKFQEQLAEEACKILVTYKGTDGTLQQNEGTPFSFDTSGGTQTITQSLQTIGKYPAETAPDLGGAINYDDEQVNGVEIVQKVLNFTETGFFAAGTITTNFRKKLASMTGKTNSASWRGYDAGELLFRGVTGSGKTHLPCELTFSFSYSENRSNFTVGDITVSNKKGWEYMWVRYGKKIDTSTGKPFLVKRPIAVYVEKLFEEVSFTELGIGN